MKNKNNTGKYNIPNISFSIFLLSTAILVQGCKKVIPENLPGEETNGKNYHRLSYTSTPAAPAILTQLVVWLKPGKISKQFNAWLDSVKLVNGDITISKKCENCDKDNPLMLLTGPGITTYISGNTAAGGKSGASSPATGDDGPIYHSLNFLISEIMPQKGYPDSIIPYKRNPVYSKGFVKVAVFDTGIDTFGLNHHPFIPAYPSCIAGGDKGWNFTYHNKIVLDSNHTMHGSTVARFITQQAVNYARNKVQILPVKTHDRDGISDLFTILCGFAYAKERKVEIINASFGFYIPKLELYKKYPIDPNVRLLREFINYYLTRNKILLVAAAGNKDDVNEHATFDLHGLPYPWQPRNLDQVSFYPASLAGDPAFPNVIAVTTIDTLIGPVSPTQNYSRHVVDIGVNADAILPGSDDDPTNHYVFKNPRSSKAPTSEGSSFATPIVTGKLCAYYDLLQPVLNKTVYTKIELWKALGFSVVKNNKPGLFAKIKDGRYMIR